MGLGIFFFSAEDIFLFLRKRKCPPRNKKDSQNPSNNLKHRCTPAPPRPGQRRWKWRQSCSS